MPKGDATYPAMTIDECLAFADEWSRGVTLYPGAQGWRVVCMLLAEEVRAMRAELDEQCRLLGMGSSREARLMAQLAESQARELRMRSSDPGEEGVKMGLSKNDYKAIAAAVIAVIWTISLPYIFGTAW